MKVRIEIEIDLHSGEYDVRFHNLTSPGGDVDVGRLPQVVARVLESVAENSHTKPTYPPQSRKPEVN